MNTMKENKHTPTPWEFCGGYTPQFMAIKSCHGYIVFQFADPAYKFENGKPITAPPTNEQRANAELIVTAVNERDMLLEVEKAAEEFLLTSKAMNYASDFLPGEKCVNYFSAGLKLQSALAALDAARKETK